MKPNVIDRILLQLWPAAAAGRAKSRALARHYDAAQPGRRTQEWRRTSSTDANAANAMALGPLRNISRNLVRNNGWARRGKRVITNHTVGWGIQPTAQSDSVRTVNRSVQGIEFDNRDRRVAYWLFPQHPGASFQTGSGVFGGSCHDVGARACCRRDAHLRHRARRPSARRAVVLRRRSRSSPISTSSKTRSCCGRRLRPASPRSSPTSTATARSAVIRMRPIPSSRPSRRPRSCPAADRQEHRVRESADGGRRQLSTCGMLRKIAAAIGVTYEDLTGDYSNVNFSSARMARLAHWANVHDWQWNMMVPRLCDPVWLWAMETAYLAGDRRYAGGEWTPQPMPMIDPDKEARARSSRPRRHGDPDQHRPGDGPRSGYVLAAVRHQLRTARRAEDHPRQRRAQAHAAGHGRATGRPRRSRTRKRRGSFRELPGVSGSLRDDPGTSGISGIYERFFIGTEVRGSPTIESSEARDDVFGPHDTSPSDQIATRDLPPLALRAAFNPRSVNLDARTVDVTWSTGAKCSAGSSIGSTKSSRWTRSTSAAAAERRRAAPEHARQLRPARRDGRRRRRHREDRRQAAARPPCDSRRPRTTRSRPGFPEGQGRHHPERQRRVPVNKFQKTEDVENKIPTYRAIDWEPFEISFVPVGADAGAGVETPAAGVTEARAQATEAEKQRQQTIRTVVRKAGLAETVADDMVARNLTVDAARAEVLDALTARTDENRTSTVIAAVPGGDATDKMIRGMSNWLIRKAGLAPTIVRAEQLAETSGSRTATSTRASSAA
jgi:hypothetical protein